MRSGWGQENPAFRQIFTSQLIPGGSKEQIDWLNELQRRTTSPDCAVRILQSGAEVDVTELLPQVTAPTLVMHVREDAAMPLQLGQQMAAGIPGAQFVVLQGQNHMFLEGEPAVDRFFEELRIFLNKWLSGYDAAWQRAPLGEKEISNKTHFKVSPDVAAAMVVTIAALSRIRYRAQEGAVFCG